MNRLIVFCFGIVIVSGSGLAVWLAHVDQPETRASVQPDTAPTEPGDWLLQRRLSGDLVSEAQLSAVTRAVSEARNRTRREAPEIANTSWQFLGPTNIGGRVLDVVVDPLDPDTVYVATASGGLMKSTDTGQTLAPAWPVENAQAIGALAISTTGRLYAGVGEGGPNGSSPTLGNKGVFVSDDGAQTWQSLGLEQSARIGRIVIDPNDTDTLFVAATGPVFAPGGQRGVYRSTDAGQSWQLVLAGANDTTGAADVIVDPTNSNRVYAVMWDHLRQASFRRLGGVGSGIFRSDDGGNNWVRLANGLPAADPGIGRIGLGIAPSDPTRLYAIYVDNFGYFHNFYATSNGGDSWSAAPANSDLADSQSSFGWWFGRVWVDPSDSQRVFVAGVSLMVSLNGGQNWAERLGFHVDQHAMTWDPANPGRVYLGNDGGLYRCDAACDAGTWLKSTVQPFTQSYTVAVSTQDPARLLTGTQDNRCLRSYNPVDPLTWNAIGCGDGLEVEIDYSNHNTIYYCSQRGFCRRSFNGGDSSNGVITDSALGDRFGWQAPLELDPNNPNTLYFASNYVSRTDNQGSTWTQISNDLTGGDPVAGDNYTFGTVSALGLAASNPNVIYAGTDDSRVWFTQNGGANWTQSTDPDLPGRWVTGIVVDPDDANHAYVSYSGYTAGETTPYILVSEDGGINFDDITSNLPQAPINDVTLGPAGEIILATDTGVFISYDDGTNWLLLGDNLPASPAMAVRVHEPGMQLFVATFGRGVWSINLTSLDTDGDQIADNTDNCLLTANNDQRDADGDGFGSMCDADFNNDCQTNFVDLDYIRAVFFANDPVADLNGDSVVNFVDLQLMATLFFQPPGPSGVTSVCP